MNYLFVDGNSLGYYHQQSDKLHNGEMEVQAAFGFVKNVRRYASILHARPMILWDGFSDKRRDFYPDYKANRDDDPDMKKMQKRMIWPGCWYPAWHRSQPLNTSIC